MQTDATEAMLHELVRASLEGDRTAYRTLLTVLARYLRIYFSRRLSPSHAAQAEDLVQETLIAIHDRRMTYDLDRPFTAWLHAIARYKLVDYLRRNASRSMIPLDDDFAVAGAQDGAIASHDLDRVLDTLPDRTSALIRRVKVDGESVAEAASAHGISEGAAKVAIHRGLKSLAARFAGGK